MLRRFKREFMNDENGTQRNWVSIEESKIRDLWIASKKNCEALYKKMNYIEIPIDVVSRMSTTPGSEDTPGMDPQSFEMEEGKEIDSNPQPKLSRSQTVKYGKLLDETAINRVKDKFEEDANNTLEEAIRKHHNLGGGGTPLWLYAVLVYFAYDDIFRMLANPLLFYPLLCVFSIIGMLYSMGLGPVMIPVARSMINLQMRNFGINY